MNWNHYKFAYAQLNRIWKDKNIAETINFGFDFDFDRLKISYLLKNWYFNVIGFVLATGTDILRFQ